MPVPKRWLQYTKYGRQIPGTRFLALKCPLKQEICWNLPEEYRFTPEMLLSEIPSVGMLIDLTNTHKYYSPQALRGVRHVKLMCPGQQVPGVHVVRSFFNAVDSFLRSSSDGLIGVHCTHGVNRTGFFICKYLVSRMGFSPELAARAFNESRGHLMERPIYVRALQVPPEVIDSVVGPEPVDEGLEYQLRRKRDEPARVVDQRIAPQDPCDSKKSRWDRSPRREGGGSRNADWVDRNRYGQDSYRIIDAVHRRRCERRDNRPYASGDHYQDSRNYRRVYGNLTRSRDQREREGQGPSRDGSSDYHMYRVLQ